MADSVDAPVQPVQSPDLRPAGDRARREPDRRQLPQRDHPVLTRRERRQPPFATNGDFATTCVRNSPCVGHDGSVGQPDSRVAR